MIVHCTVIYEILADHKPHTMKHRKIWEMGALFQQIYTQPARIGSPLIPLIAIIGEISPSILAYLYLEQVKVWSRIWHQQQTHPFSIW